MAQTPEPAYLTIARIRKARGRRGEVAAEILTDFPERFQSGRKMLASGPRGEQTLFLEQSWFHKGLVILKFQGYETISDAETLVGSWIQVPRSEGFPLPAGTVYVADLVGCVVQEGDKLLGKVEAVEETGGVPLLQVVSADGEVLIPFARDICTAVDVQKKKIHVRLPEGLQELNRPGTSGSDWKATGLHRRRHK